MIRAITNATSIPNKAIAEEYNAQEKIPADFAAFLSQCLNQDEEQKEITLSDETAQESESIELIEEKTQETGAADNQDEQWLINPETAVFFRQSFLQSENKLTQLGMTEAREEVMGLAATATTGTLERVERNEGQTEPLLEGFEQKGTAAENDVIGELEINDEETRSKSMPEQIADESNRAQATVTQMKGTLKSQPEKVTVNETLADTENKGIAVEIQNKEKYVIQKDQSAPSDQVIENKSEQKTDHQSQFAADDEKIFIRREEAKLSSEHQLTERMTNGLKTAFSVLEEIEEGSTFAKDSTPVQSLTNQQLALEPNEIVKDSPLLATAKTIETAFLSQAEVLKKGDTVLVKLTLKPETLGEINIHLSLKDNQLISKIVVQHPETKELLEKNLHQLTTTLADRNIQLSEVQISLDSQAQSGFSFSHPSQQEESQQQPFYMKTSLLSEERPVMSEESEQKDLSSSISILA